MAERNTPARIVASRSGPYLSEATSAAAKAYNDHHFNCHVCVASGLRPDTRCADGAALHEAYDYAIAADKK